MMRGGIVHITGYPDDIADALLPDVAQKIGNLQLSAERITRFGVRDAFECSRSVADDQANRQIARDDLPRGPGR
jgi:hypothetical protein